MLTTFYTYFRLGITANFQGYYFATAKSDSIKWHIQLTSYCLNNKPATCCICLVPFVNNTFMFLFSAAG